MPIKSIIKSTKSMEELESLYTHANTLTDMVEKAMMIKETHVFVLEGTRANGDLWQSEGAILIDSKGVVYRTGSKGIIKQCIEGIEGNAYTLKGEEFEINGRKAIKLLFESLGF